MLDDKYRVEHLLAVGGMGAVYLATHVKLRKRVAIKVLNPQVSSKGMVERFHREAITASQIGHEGIAQVTDLGTTPDGEPFFVMEYLDGESLGARLEASGPLPIDLACELGCSILAPLAAAHQAGIVHRDLKPDNVFLVKRSRGEMVKLLDFGISRTAGSEAEFRLTKTGLVLGTPYYMSPEQARGENEVTPAADLYAFGVILYEMLVGKVPIEGDNYNQLMYRVLTGDYERPRARRPEIPEELEQIILQAMALEPADRPGSAVELEQRLLDFCRPSFRVHQYDRASSSGFRPALATPPAGSATVPAAGPVTADGAVAAAAGSKPALALPLPTEETSGTAHTVLAPVSEVNLAATAPRPRRSRAWLAVAALVVIGGAATATAVIAGGRKSKPEPTTATGAIAGSSATGTEPAPTPPVQPPQPPQPVEAVKPPPPAAPAEVTLKFEIEPAGAAAVVTLDGVIVKDRQITRPKSDVTHKVRITAPGFVTVDDTVKFDENQKLRVRLARTGRPVGPGSAGRPRPGEGKVERVDRRIESKSPYEQ
jgi:serine/threonine-protein kinase